MDTPVSRKYNGGHAGGYTMFEFLVVMILLCGIYYVLIDRMMMHRKQFETAEVRWTIAALKTAASVERASAPLRGRHGAGPVDPNPIRLLQPAPRNYIGERCNPPIAELEGGSWYYDRCNRQLVYVPAREKLFASKNAKILRFNVESLRMLAGNEAISD